MSRKPMSDLERRLLYPQDKRKIPEGWAEQAEHDRCPECGRLTGHFAGRLDEPCICPKPEPVVEKKPRRIYQPVPAFDIELYSIGQEYQLSDDMRLNMGLGMMDW
jgi:hypothetical protein